MFTFQVAKNPTCWADDATRFAVNEWCTDFPIIDEIPQGFQLIPALTEEEENAAKDTAPPRALSVVEDSSGVILLFIHDSIAHNFTSKSVASSHAELYYEGHLRLIFQYTPQINHSSILYYGPATFHNDYRDEAGFTMSIQDGDSRDEQANTISASLWITIAAFSVLAAGLLIILVASLGLAGASFIGVTGTAAAYTLAAGLACTFFGSSVLASTVYPETDDCDMQP